MFNAYFVNLYGYTFVFSFLLHAVVRGDDVASFGRGADGGIRVDGGIGAGERVDGDGSGVGIRLDYGDIGHLIDDNQIVIFDQDDFGGLGGFLFAGSRYILLCIIEE